LQPPRKQATLSSNFKHQYQAQEAKPLLWAVAGTAWGSCALLTLFNLDAFKKLAAYINLALQSFSGVACLAASLNA